jgi:hypothetical protein
MVSIAPPSPPSVLLAYDCEPVQWVQWVLGGGGREVSFYAGKGAGTWN